MQPILKSTKFRDSLPISAGVSGFSLITLTYEGKHSNGGELKKKRQPACIIAIHTLLRRIFNKRTSLRQRKAFIKKHITSTGQLPGLQFRVLLLFMG